MKLEDPRPAPSATVWGGLKAAKQVEEEVRGRLQRLEECDRTESGDDADYTAEDHPLAQVRRGGDSVGGSGTKLAEAHRQSGHHSSQMRCQSLSGASPAASPKTVNACTKLACSAGSTASRICSISRRRRWVTRSTSRRPDALEAQRDDTTIGDVTAAGDELLAGKAVAHARRRRGVDTKGLGEVDWALGAAGRENDEGAVLGQGYLGLVLGQGAGRDGDQDPAGGEDSVGELSGAGRRSALASADHGRHTVIVVMQ